MAPATFAQLKGTTVPVGGLASEPVKPKAPSSITLPSPSSLPSPVTQQPSALRGNFLNANTSILLLGLDDVDLRQASDWQSSDDKAPLKSAETPASILEKQLVPPLANVSDRPPGRAQMVAAPLRRIMTEAGAVDVLNTAMDGPSMVRAINSARLSPRVISTARAVLRRVEQDVLQSSSGLVELPAELQQDAITAFARIGQAMGYRAVVAIAAPSSVTAGSPRALVLLVDSELESGQIIPIIVPEQANSMQDTDNISAAAGALLLPRLASWPPSSSAKKSALAAKYLQAAKDAAAEGKDLPAAQDYINQVVGLQPNNADAFETLGDLLQKAAPEAAATAYSRALNITPDNGPLWSKMALTYTFGNNPSWPNALDAAQQALSAGYDSAMLRTVMASAEFGRGRIFTKAGRFDDADIANRKAKEYMAQAMKLAPKNSSVNADISKLMAENLYNNGQFNEAASTLDLVARQFPDDLELQKQYATALSSADDRKEDAFVAWANVWRLQGDDAVQLDAERYKNLGDGFDMHVFNLAKAASMLTSSVSTGTIPSSTALPQVQHYAAQVNSAVAALQSMRPPAGRLSTNVQVARLIAGDLFAQAVQSYLLYLQNGDQTILAHGGQLHYQAIDRLNSARKAS